MILKQGARKWQYRGNNIISIGAIIFAVDGEVWLGKLSNKHANIRNRRMLPMPQESYDTTLTIFEVIAYNISSYLEKQGEIF